MTPSGSLCDTLIGSRITREEEAPGKKGGRYIHQNSPSQWCYQGRTWGQRSRAVLTRAGTVCFEVSEVIHIIIFKMSLIIIYSVFNNLSVPVKGKESYKSLQTIWGGVVWVISGGCNPSNPILLQLFSRMKIA